MENFLCLRRHETGALPGGPFKGCDSETPDHWRVQPNGDKTCSYCGSMNTDQFTEFMREVIKRGPQKGNQFGLGSTDKRYKFYVHRPEVKNAGDGAIKFYMHHAPIDPQNPKNYTKEFIDLLVESVNLSNSNWEEGLKP